MPTMRSRWYSGERMRDEFSQERERPDAPRAGPPSVTRVTLTPRRARWTAEETPKTPPPITATWETADEEFMRTCFPPDWLGPLPPLGAGGAEERVDDAHVEDRVVDAPLERPLAQHGAGERVALRRVLVGGRQLDRLATAAREVSAVVDEDAGRGVRRGVERDLDLDPPARAQDLHALGQRQPGGAGEAEVPAARELREAARHAVGPRDRVVVEQPDHALGLAAEDVAGGADGVAADVVEPAAADVGPVADVPGIGEVVGEERLDGARLADAPARHDLPGPPPLRVVAHHEGLGDEAPGPRRGVGQLPGVLGVEPHRLLAQHVLAR